MDIMRRQTLTTMAVCLLAVLLVVFAKNRSTGSDPRATLLVTESILTNQTIKLDHYGEDLLRSYGYAIHNKNGHYYYYFPLGTSVASLPFVALARGLGLEMRKSEPEVQIAIAAFAAALTLFFLVKLAAIFLSYPNALLIASVFWFGTSLASTTGAALWSHNFAALFALIAIYVAIRVTRSKKSQYWPLVSFSLIAAYLCRPTLALLSPFAILYLFTYDKRAATKTALLLAVFLSAFVGFSFYEFGQALPDYYLPKRLAGGYFLEALYGNLLSPARGLLVYSPFILAAWLCFSPDRGRRFGLDRSWLLIGLGWPILHLIFVSRFPHWWAGWSFGARFMTDVLPGFFLLTLYTWPETLEGMRTRIAVGLLALASVFSVGVNSGQGLFNRYADVWSGEPNIDKFPQYLFDWSYPQFAAHKAGHEKRLMRHQTSGLSPLKPSDVLLHTSENLVFPGWSGAEATHRWSSARSASIIFQINTADRFAGEIVVLAGSLGRQRIEIFLNEVKMFSGELNSWNETITISFSPSLLNNGRNVLRFDLPDARRPEKGDPRVLALALKSFSLR